MRKDNRIPVSAFVCNNKMAGYNTIFIHWKKSQKDVETNLLQLQKRITTEAVHDIRVAIKKLRSYLNLYSVLKKEPGWEYLLGKTDILFDVLGRHRDVETCLALTIAFEKETNTACTEWKNHLQLQLKITRSWVNQEIHRYHKNELHKIALLLKQDNSLAADTDFSQSLYLVIKNHLSETKKHFRQPHFTRKKLKELYYWIALFNNENTLAQWHQKELHVVLDDLGNWQDNEILATRVRHFRKDYLPKPFKEYLLLKDFQNRIKEKKSLLLRSASSKTRGWMNKVMNKEKSEA